MKSPKSEDEGDDVEEMGEWRTLVMKLMEKMVNIFSDMATNKQVERVNGMRKDFLMLKIAMNEGHGQLYTAPSTKSFSVEKAHRITLPNISTDAPPSRDTTNQHLSPESDKSKLNRERKETEHYRKLLKDMAWPDPSKSEVETWQRLVNDAIDDAQQEGIPDQLICKGIKQFLLGNNKTICRFSSLILDIKPNTITNIRSIINKLSNRKLEYSAEERFRTMQIQPDEDTLDFIDRLQVTHRDMFGSEKPGGKRRIKTQFINGLIIKSQRLNSDEKSLLMVYENLNDMAVNAQNTMDRKVEKFQNKYCVRETQPLNNALSESQESGVPPHITGHNCQGPGYAPTPTHDNERRSRQPPVYAQYTNETNSRKATATDVMRGMTTDGRKMCFRCTCYTHLARDCKSKRFCAVCKSDTHTTRGHAKFEAHSKNQDPAY